MAHISKWASALKNSITGSEEENEKSKNYTKKKKKSSKYNFWKKSSGKTPGTIRQIRGAQYPPITSPSPSQSSTSEKRKPEASPHVAENLEPELENTAVSISSQNRAASNTSVSSNKSSRREEALMEQIGSLLLEPNLQIQRLRETCWSGIPKRQRTFCWKLLLGCLPRNTTRRVLIQEKRKNEYQEFLRVYFNVTADKRTESELGQMHQIELDVPRTLPETEWFHLPQIEKALTRTLFIWALRHPASGYVQGMNDLMSVFLYVFINQHLRETCNIESENPQALSILKDLTDEQVMDIEANSFWCFHSLLDGIQDNYTPHTPGLQRMIYKMEELVNRVDINLGNHLKNQQIIYHSFALRWMNCLLVRELPIELILRLWDTYLCQGDSIAAGFKDFHVYVCAAYLKKFSKTLLEMDFQEMIIFLQNPPTSEFTESDVEEILSQAYLWFSLFNNAQSHFQ